MCCRARPSPVNQVLPLKGAIGHKEVPVTGEPSTWTQGHLENILDPNCITAGITIKYRYGSDVIFGPIYSKRLSVLHPSPLFIPEFHICVIPGLAHVVSRLSVKASKHASLLVLAALLLIGPRLCQNLASLLSLSKVCFPSLLLSQTGKPISAQPRRGTA